MSDRVLPIRLDDEFIERLERLAEALSARAEGAKVSRTSAMRVALEKGLFSLESELGLGRTKHRGK